jgi:DNA-binding MarR family transcriptional regulator
MEAASNMSAGRFIDRHRYVPHYLALIANVFTSGSSREYLARYGVGLNEARIVGVLGHVPGLTPSQLGTAMGMNKSVVSRSLAAMVRQGLVEQSGPARALRTVLTPAGHVLHDRVVFMALRREERLLQGFSAAEREVLLDFLVRMLRNTESMRFPND